MKGSNITVSRLWAICFRLVKVSGLAVLLIAASIASYCGIIRYMGNIHVVERGRLYRSAQLDKDQFEHVIEKYQIKSILNLRGDSPGEDWYDDEIAVSKTLDVKHLDYGIWASGIVTPKQIGEILKIVRDAPKPLLIHCQGGADRSGLVAALYVAEVQGKSANEADQQLSLFYGHFPYLTSKTDAMDKSFWAYVKAHPSSQHLRPPPQIMKAAVPPG